MCTEPYATEICMTIAFSRPCCQGHRKRVMKKNVSVNTENIMAPGGVHTCKNIIENICTRLGTLINSVYMKIKIKRGKSTQYQSCNSHLKGDKIIGAVCLSYQEFKKQQKKNK